MKEVTEQAQEAIDRIYDNYKLGKGVRLSMPECEALCMTIFSNNLGEREDQ